MGKQRKLEQLGDVMKAPESVLVLTSQLMGPGMPKVRFVKIEISPGKEWLYLDEVVVNPVRTSAKE